MSKSTRVTEKGQATIPKHLREKYDLQPGDEVVWVDTDDGIVVKKRTRTSGRGMLLPDDTPEEKGEEVAEALQQRLRERRDREYEEAWMPTYTADAVALLTYLVDALPARADQLFAKAEAGETVLRAPSTALAEVLYSVSRDKDLRGVTLTGTPEDARQALVGNGPVSIAPVANEELIIYAGLASEFSLHDGLIVASHRARETDAIITTDEQLSETGIETVWA
jgi:AbrB family looped-hinge helix DNA binding protein